MPIPSEAIMLFGGALAAGITIAGTSFHLNVIVVALTGAFGNLLGSVIAYLAGRTGGRVLVERWGKYVLVKPRDLTKAQAFFASRGEWAVLVGRVIPVIRTFISLPAGIAEMPLFRFTLFTLLGSLPWTFGLAYAGQALAGNWQNLSKYSTPISIIFGLIIVGLIVWWYIKRRSGAEAKSI